MFHSILNLLYLSHIWTAVALPALYIQYDNTCRVDWFRIDPASVEKYQFCLQASLPTLFDEMMDCSDPNCKSHKLH